MLDESELQFILVDWLLSSENKLFNNIQTIMFEINYNNNRRRADCVIINDNKVIGIEIKSDKDVLTNLSNQTNDYINNFDYVYVLTTDRYIDSITNISSSIGVLKISENGITIIKESINFNKNTIDKEDFVNKYENRLLELKMEFQGNYHKDNILKVMKILLYPNGIFLKWYGGF